ncbi:hypothetical protein RMSM_01388 [Rhodopirellula maiorica SM1]|uniref:Uncharacterized protein n=2 Tax=Novipirellula TaxID=2795426 RepID=M5RR38_9BACT|nr:hypothetical protein RMSM_01388 [Rhodopirellula maiorica SM1]
MTTMDMIVEPDGNVRLVYDEAIDLHLIGKVAIQRGSHVEPTSAGKWSVDLSPVGGPTLGPFDCRSQAIAVEVAWLREHWLSPQRG